MSSGDDPLDADAPAGDAGDGIAPGGGHSARPSAAVRRRGGKSAKGRKRRRRRRGPVYAPGMRPSGGGASSAADSASAEPAVVSPAAIDVTPPATGENPLYAALDLGTNNCRLLIATPRDRGFRVVDAFSRIVRLGEGIGVSSRLSEAAMARSIDALKVCAAKIAGRKVTRARLIATEACRIADNGMEFIERVRVETGLALEIVSQETEAHLAVAGCASLVDPTASGVILFDIGGGSSELVWIDLARGAGNRRQRMTDRLRTWMSLPVGVVNVSERHGGRSLTPEEFAVTVAEVSEMLSGFPEAAALDQAVAGGRVHLLGTSGTVTTLAGIHLNLPRYDRRRVDGTWLTARQVDDLVATLVAMDHDARVANPCIGDERADLVLAGCAILQAIRGRWPCERLRVADRGLREGMLVELMAEDGVWRPRSGRRQSERRHE